MKDGFKMETVLAFIIIFGALVFFHELGHFLFAKRAGILVREFAIGMGPKILGITRGETLYTVRLLPIGGYVRMAGEEMDAIHLRRIYRTGDGGTHLYCCPRPRDNSRSGFPNKKNSRKHAKIATD